MNIGSPNTLTEEEPGIAKIYSLRPSELANLIHGQDIQTDEDTLCCARNAAEKEARWLRCGRIALDCTVERQSSLEVFTASLTARLPRPTIRRLIRAKLTGNVEDADAPVSVSADLVPVTITVADRRWLSEQAVLKKPATRGP